MGFDLRALQLKVESENSVEHTRDVLTKAVEFFSTFEDNQEKVKLIFDQMRGHFDNSNLEDKGIFFWDSQSFVPSVIPNEFKAYSLGIFNSEKKPIFNGRLVYPVRDINNKVMGLCGWDPDMLPKYLDSVTYGYSAKRNTMYGMEKLSEYYTSNKPVFVVEGIPCCNYLRTKGFQSLALLGSSISGFTVNILERFKDKCILIPDNDEAGLAIYRKAKYSLPMARSYVSLVAKDPDDTRRFDNGIYEKQFLQELSNISNPFSITKIIRQL